MIRITPIALALTFMLPAAFGMLVPGISQSIGVMSAALFWITAALIGAQRPYMLHRSDGYFLALPLSIVVVMSAHIAISSTLVNDVDFGRFAGSSAILLVLFAAAHFASKKLLGVSASTLVRATDWVLLLLAFIGLAGAAGVPALGPGDHAKPVVIFAEPSHFALAVLPVMLFRLAVSRRSTQFALIGVALLIAAALQSLTMIAGIMAISALILRQTLLLVLMIPLAGAALAFDLTYYAERLAFSSESNNLSTLVFLQGWQNALLNFGETHGFGVGFQQMGVAGSTGEIAQKISQMLSGESLSLLDGGTTASKLIAEFGALGILLLVLFVGAAVASILFIRRSQFIPARLRDTRRLFFCAVITTYLIELFMRGVGYFSPGGFLAIVALISLARMDTQRSRSASLSAPAIQTQTVAGAPDSPQA